MINLRELFYGTGLVIVFSIIQENIIDSFLKVDLFPLLLLIVYPAYIYIKANRRLTPIMTDCFGKEGYLVVSEETYSWGEILRNELKQIIAINAYLKRFAYLDDFLRVFVLKNKEGEQFEVSVKIISGWSWREEMSVIIVAKKGV